MRKYSICQTGNGDPPPKKPPTETPKRRQNETPAEMGETDEEAAE